MNPTQRQLTGVLITVDHRENDYQSKGWDSQSGIELVIEYWMASGVNEKVTHIFVRNRKIRGFRQLREGGRCVH
jgi:hypothetical protein